VTVAVEARERQILLACRATVLLRENMIDLERDRQERLGESAVLASRTCALSDERCEGRVHSASGGESSPRERTARLRSYHFEQAADTAITL
jgi:hypothetical protein